MATYAELAALDATASDLREKVTQACKIAAAVFIVGTPSATEKAFVEDIMANPRAVGTKVFPLVIAANKAADIGDIIGASDVAIQSNVDDIIAKILAS